MHLDSADTDESTRMKVLTLNPKKTHETNPECPSRLVLAPDGRNWMCWDCGVYIIQEWVEYPGINPTVPIEISLDNFNGGIEQLQQTYREHGYAIVKMMYPLKPLSIDLLSGDASYFGKPEPFEMNTLEDLKYYLRT